MTVVKICGIKDAMTLSLLHQLGVDYAGFVFAASKRQVTPIQVRKMLIQVKKHPALVGVFVDPTIDELWEAISMAPLDVIQLHGEESTELIQEIKENFSCQVWKAIRVKERSQVEQSIKLYQPHVDAFLLDAYHPTQAGGTGERFSWAEIPQLKELVGETPFFVAGGINPANVGELIGVYQAERIDLSSGVETEDQKDPEKIRQLMERVRKYETNRRKNNSCTG